MPLSVNHKRHSVLFTVLMLCFIYFFEILSIALLFSKCLGAYRELVGNISVIVVIFALLILKSILIKGLL